MSGSPQTSRRYDAYWSEADPPPVRDPLAPRRRELLWSLVAPRPGQRLLDAGAGDGTLVAEAARRGLDAVGLEVSERAVERARQTHPEIELIPHSVEDRPWPVPAESFDVVVSFEVIEHLLEPAALLAGARDALRPGGKLALSTPYHGLLKNLAIALVAFERHYDVEGEHVRFFSDAALGRLLAREGFAVERVAHLGRVRGLWANTFVWARKR